MASFQTLLCKASSTVQGSPAELKKPYRICPSVYTLGLRIPSCSRVRGLGCDGDTAATGEAEEPAAAPPSEEDPRSGGGVVEDPGRPVAAGAGLDPDGDVVGACTCTSCAAPPGDDSRTAQSGGGGEASRVDVAPADWDAGVDTGAGADSPSDASVSANPDGDRQGKTHGFAPEPVPASAAPPACDIVPVSSSKLLEFSPLGT